MKIIHIALTIVLLASCSSTDNKSTDFLTLAKSNKNELQKVIDYFEELGDEEKIKATTFLLENLDGQYYYTGTVIDKYTPFFNQLDSLNQRGISKRASMESNDLIPIINESWDKIKTSITQQDYSDLRQIQDIQSLKAKYIIENINQAFSEWKSNKWSQNVKFDDFCEYILPYKVFNESPENWRAFFSAKYAWVKNSYASQDNPVVIADTINKEIATWFNFSSLFYSYPFDMGLKRLIQGQIGGCNHMVTITTYANRAVGIPCAVDYVPHYGNRSLGHTWNVVFDKNMKPIPYNGASTGWLSMGYVFHKQTLDVKLPKIHRKTYCKQDSCLASIVDNNEEIPRIFKDMHFKDVTSEYMPVSEVAITIEKTIPENCNYAYLCIFNNQSWLPVEWSKIIDGKANFKNMGRGIVYLPAFFKNNQIIPAGQPIIVSNNGDITNIQIEKGRAQSAKLFYKYPPNLTAENDSTNNIIPGDNYELYYWEDGWISLGKKTTADRKADIDSLGFDFKKTRFFSDVNNREFLFYENVPVGSLFLLHNLSQGKEERIFTLDETQQVWW